jgi:hypothetical protein
MKHRSLAIHISLLFVLSLAITLWQGGLFAGWDGRAVSYRALGDAENTSGSVPVLVLADDGSYGTWMWPKEIVLRHGVPSSPVNVPPPQIPDTAAKTTKRPFQQYFTVNGGQGSEVPSGTVTYSTSTPQSLFIGLLVFFVGLCVRNMIVSGHPLHARPVPGKGRPLKPGRGGRSGTFRSPPRKGPPPPKRSRGRGRR